MTESDSTRPDCPVCGQEMDLGDWVEEPDDGGPATYFYVCRNDDCPESKHWVNELPGDEDGDDDPSDADGEVTMEYPDDDAVGTMLQNADLSDGGEDGD